MSLEKLLKQKAELEAKIKDAERVQKMRGKFDRVMQESISKNADVLLCDPQIFARKLNGLMADFAGNLDHRQQ